MTCRATLGCWQVIQNRAVYMTSPKIMKALIRSSRGAGCGLAWIFPALMLAVVVVVFLKAFSNVMFTSSLCGGYSCADGGVLRASSDVSLQHVCEPALRPELCMQLATLHATGHKQYL